MSEKKAERIANFRDHQPEFINVTPCVRLRRFDHIDPHALEWYQDPETLRLVDGPTRQPYDWVLLERMYRYLAQHGELYYIEYRQEDEFIPIGDVTLMPDDLPIVIGAPEFRGKGIGYHVVRALMARARENGWRTLMVQDIYDYNAGSKRLFKKCGFVPYQPTKLGQSYRCDLDKQTNTGD